MAKKLKLLLTYDHEVPLGGWKGDVNNCIFNQTDEILSIGDEYKVPITLFTDILCAYRFKDWDYNGFYVPYKNQLSKAILSGHDVQLHLHPHWLTTQLHSGNLVPSSDFKLADFAEVKSGHNIESIIKLGIEELKEICEQVKKDYKCIAYRAGGFNIAPDTERIMDSLFENGVRFDSSINKGYFYKSALTEVDYRNINQPQNWFLINDKIYEIPVTGVKAGLLTNLKHIYRKYMWKQHKPLPVGKTIHSGKTNLFDKIRFVFSTRMLTFDLYTLTNKDLVEMINKELSILQKSNANVAYATSIAHPKNLGKYHYELHRDFIQSMKNNYADKVEFINYQQAWDELKHNFI